MSLNSRPRRRSETMSPNPAGVLDYWHPLELDIPSLVTIRPLITHIPNIIHPILSIGATSFCLGTLFATLSTTRPYCEVRRPVTGNLYLVTCRRVCHTCFSTHPSYCPVKFASPALLTVAPAKHTLLGKIPRMLTVPGSKTPLVRPEANFRVFTYDLTSSAVSASSSRLSPPKSTPYWPISIKVVADGTMRNVVNLCITVPANDAPDPPAVSFASASVRSAGFSVTVFEQDASPTARPRDWNIGIYWAQSRIEECLTTELNALVDTVQTNPSYQRHEDSVLPILNGATGEILKELAAPNAIRLRRRSWLGLIRTGIDVRYSKKLVSISASGEGVTATFADGTTEAGDLLFGAEGAHSVTREWLFQHNPQGAVLQQLPISSFATLTKFSHETALAVRNIHTQYYITLDPSGLFNFVSLHDCTHDDPGEWVFMILLTWRPKEDEDAAALAADPDLLLERVRGLTKSLAYPFDATYRDIPRGTRTWYSARLGYWPTKPWDNRGGRVTLAGDAAHVQTYHRGQGLGNAIADVAELQTHLRAMRAHTREELARAVGKYEQDVWKRGYDVVMQNLQNTLDVHDWAKVSQSMLVTTGVGRDRAWETGAGQA
ncbi:hypothetical protein VTI74DRAFT_6540 [Chaetomium olivicolor]